MDKMNDFFNYMTEMKDKLEEIIKKSANEREACREAVKILEKANPSVPLDTVIERLKINIEEE